MMALSFSFQDSFSKCLIEPSKHRQLCAVPKKVNLKATTVLAIETLYIFCIYTLHIGPILDDRLKEKFLKP